MKKNKFCIKLSLSLITLNMAAGIFEVAPTCSIIKKQDNGDTVNLFNKTFIYYNKNKHEVTFCKDCSIRK